MVHPMIRIYSRYKGGMKLKKFTEGKSWKIRRTVWFSLLGAGLPILTAGCGSTAASEPETAPVLPEKTMEITIVNASNIYVSEILISWSDDIEADLYDILGHAGKDGLEPGEVLTAEAPV